MFFQPLYISCITTTVILFIFVLSHFWFLYLSPTYLTISPDTQVFHSYSTLFEYSIVSSNYSNYAFICSLYFVFCLLVRLFPSYKSPSSKERVTRMLPMYNWKGVSYNWLLISRIKLPGVVRVTCFTVQAWKRMKIK